METEMETYSETYIHIVTWQLLDRFQTFKYFLSLSLSHYVPRYLSGVPPSVFYLTQGSKSEGSKKNTHNAHTQETLQDFFFFFSLSIAYWCTITYSAAYRFPKQSTWARIQPCGKSLIFDPTCRSTGTRFLIIFSEGFQNNPDPFFFFLSTYLFFVLSSSFLKFGRAQARLSCFFPSLPFGLVGNLYSMY